MPTMDAMAAEGRPELIDTLWNVNINSTSFSSMNSAN